MSRLRAVRGATTVDADTPEAIQEALDPLLARLVAENGLAEEDVVSVFMTVTGDIHAASPPRIARTLLNWQRVPILCSTEPDITGFPARCIRFLIQFYTDKKLDELRPIYLKGATVLRPDLVSE